MQIYHGKVFLGERERDGEEESGERKGNVENVELRVEGERKVKGRW